MLRAVRTEKVRLDGTNTCIYYVVLGWIEVGHPRFPLSHVWFTSTPFNGMNLQTFHRNVLGLYIYLRGITPNQFINRPQTLCHAILSVQGRVTEDRTFHIMFVLDMSWKVLIVYLIVY